MFPSAAANESFPELRLQCPPRCISLLRQGACSGSPDVPSSLTYLNKLLPLFDLEFINVGEVNEAQDCALGLTGGLESGG